MLKKLMAVLVCLSVCLSFGGCNNAKQDDTAAKQALESVLNGEQDFTYKMLIFDRDVTQANLGKFIFQTPVSAHEYFLPCAYTYLDVDGDKTEEMLIVDMELSTLLFLRYDGEKVVGYLVDQRFDVNYIMTDGTFLGVSYNHDENYKINGTNYFVCKVELNGLDCQVDYLARQHEGDAVYQIGEKTVTKDEAEAYIRSWKENGTKVEWTRLRSE